MLKTDAAFCGSDGGEVRKIMERRRRHEECDEGRCEVVRGERCDWRRVAVKGKKEGRWLWRRGGLGRVGRWEIGQAVGIVLALFVAFVVAVMR